MALYVNIPATSSGSAGTASVALSRAKALLGPTITTVMGSEFENDQWYRTSLVSGTVTPTVTDSGGVIVLTTTATANRSAAILPHGTIDLLSNPQTSLWYQVGRIRVPTAIDAASVCDMRLTIATIGAPQVIVGVIGSIDTSFFSYLVQSNAGAITASGATTVAIDTSYHLFEMWNDATNLTFAIDGVTVITTASTNAGTNPVTPMVSTANGATSADVTVKLDYLWLCTPTPAT